MDLCLGDRLPRLQRFDNSLAGATAGPSAGAMAGASAGATAGSISGAFAGAIAYSMDERLFAGLTQAPALVESTTLAIRSKSQKIKKRG